MPPPQIRGQIFDETMTPDFHIGGILLDKLPEYKKEKLGRQKAEERFYKDLIKHAKIVSPRVGGATSYKGNPLPEIVEGGFGPLMAENALKTMIDAEQFKYLLAAGLPNKDWKIFVEMHYYRARDKEMAGFHKDTRGQTLFVNLNYHIEDQQQQGLATRGPEYVLNPPPNAKHDAQIYGTVGKENVPVNQQKTGSLPQKFTSDLTEVRQELDAPNVIKSAGTIQPYGYVAFVDEAIHHATPFDQGRYVTPTEFKKYLEETYAKELDEIRSAETGRQGMEHQNHPETPSEEVGEVARDDACHGQPADDAVQPGKARGHERRRVPPDAGSGWGEAGCGTQVRRRRRMVRSRHPRLWTRDPTQGDRQACAPSRGQPAGRQGEIAGAAARECEP